jgi:aldose 1-epimerase
VEDINFLKWIRIILLLTGFLVMLSCRENDQHTNNEITGNIMKAEFGKLPNGQSADIYTLTNGRGMKMKVTNYGGIIVSFTVPDRDGNPGDVVLGYDKLENYLEDSPYFGAIIGRYGNRIGGSKFMLDGVEYSLAANDGANHLHGGIKGFDKILWHAQPFRNDSGVGLIFTYLGKDGEEGYPGNLSVKITYTLSNDNSLRLNYEAISDKPTICNLTHHSYFNLAGHGNGDILNHILMINADQFTPVDEGLIPTGELLSVKGTPFDFRQPAAIGARINEENQQLKYGRGYDHNWVLNRQTEKDLELAATLYDPSTGRFMEVWTQEPGIQFYCGNFLNGSNVGKDGIAYEYRTGLCLETQHFPDSPNKPDFPSVTIRPGEVYKSATVYKFSVK